MDETEAFLRSLNKPKIKTNLIKNLYKNPKKDIKLDAGYFPYINPNMRQQADLLVLPNDKNYYLCLVVTDEGSRLTDAEPIIDKKPETVFSALKKIYRRGILKKPLILSVDGGSEFKSCFSTQIDDYGIELNKTKPSRHRKVGLVEAKNKIIGRYVYQLILKKELATKQKSSAWTKNLPIIIKIMNEKAVKQVAVQKPIKEELMKDGFPTTNEKEFKLLKVGDSVRESLDVPINYDKKRLYGKFRATDIKFNPTVSKIKYVLLQPGQPIYYMLDNDSKVGYTRNQLQLVSKREKPIEEEEVDSDDENRKEFQKIVDKKVVGRKIYYLIKWKHLRPKENTWELKSSLMKDIAKEINLYERKLLENTNKA